MSTDIQFCCDELISSSLIYNQTNNLFDYNESVDELQFENIDREKANFISSILTSYQGSTPYVYKDSLLDKDVYITGTIRYSSSKDFVLQTKGGIIFEPGGYIINNGSGSIILKAGVGGCEAKETCPSILFKADQAQIILKDDAPNNHVKLYYNPSKGEENHKYQNPENFNEAVSPQYKLKAYMLINDAFDLQMVNLFLAGSYALSKDIDATVTKGWDNGKGFLPIGSSSHPFSGNFDGNGYTIGNLFISRPEEDHIGLFGFSSGGAFNYNELADVTVKNFNITGHDYVGLLAGATTFTNVHDVHCFEKSVLQGDNVVGGMVGEKVV